jgi:hypothetical protein
MIDYKNLYGELPHFSEAWRSLAQGSPLEKEENRIKSTLPLLYERRE